MIKRAVDPAFPLISECASLRIKRSTSPQSFSKIGDELDCPRSFQVQSRFGLKVSRSPIPLIPG
jgi:hypothetical protein